MWSKVELTLWSIPGASAATVRLPFLTQFVCPPRRPRWTTGKLPDDPRRALGLRLAVDDVSRTVTTVDR